MDILVGDVLLVKTLRITAENSLSNIRVVVTNINSNYNERGKIDGVHYSVLLETPIPGIDHIKYSTFPGDFEKVN